MRTAPYGAWPSPVSAAMAAAAGVRLSEPWLGTGGSTWWLERRPSNAGHTTLVRDGEDVTSPETNVRTRVHEYGGGAWLLHGDTAFFSEYSDQRLYRLDPGAEPRAITPEPPRPSSIRYADGRATPDGECDPHRARDPRRGRRARERPGGRARRRLRRAPGARLRPRLLRLSAAQPRRHPGVLDLLGPPQHAVGRHRAVGGAARRPGGRAPGCRRRRASPSGSPTWAPTAGSTGCPTATGGGTSSARASRSRTSRRSSATRSGSSAGPPTTSSPTARSCACGCRARWSAWACCARGSRGSRTSGFPTTPWATPT